MKPLILECKNNDIIMYLLYTNRVSSCKFEVANEIIFKTILCTSSHLLITYKSY